MRKRSEIEECESGTELRKREGNGTGPFVERNDQDPHWESRVESSGTGEMGFIGVGTGGGRSEVGSMLIYGQTKGPSKNTRDFLPHGSRQTFGSHGFCPGP